MAALSLIALQRLSLVVANGGYSVVACRLLIAVASLVGEHRPRVCEIQQWLYMASVVVSRAVELGLSSRGGDCCSAACGTFQDQGPNPCPLHRGGGLPTAPPGKSKDIVF